ncbi:MAG: L,D-transpeptidase [Candidatus Kapabacteria bacterium]|nr:L,D-transpeptidase [Candidatus Kapabacteria bacterium]MDW8224901.1 L,D-transpeptidase [Bacteroidota bacterium]
MVRAVFSCCVAWLLASLPFEDIGGTTRQSWSPSAGVVPTSFLRFFPMRDTIYTLTPWYLELDLQRQRLYLVGRNGERREYKVSSGAPWVAGGIETPTGLFTLQTKATLAISRQFDNTRMLYWMGFSGNVGFHALEGWGYYRHLGHRASSHGCVRLSREDAHFLYRLLPRGTPVLVYKEEPARILAFLHPEEFLPGRDWLLSSGGYAQEQLLRKRLEVLYLGKTQELLPRRLVLDGNTILQPGGYPVGAVREIPLQQPPLLLPASTHFLSVLPLAVDGHDTAVLPDSLLP